MKITVIKQSNGKVKNLGGYCTWIISEPPVPTT